jgi:hypothetical protein
MTRGASMFKQSDLTRALRAAAKAGVAVRIEFEDGKPVVIMENGKRVCAATDNEWDEVFGKNNGNAQA